MPKRAVMDRPLIGLEDCAVIESVIVDLLMLILAFNGLLPRYLILYVPVFTSHKDATAVELR